MSFSIMQLLASSMSPIHRFPQQTQGILEGGPRQQKAA